jgi:hypothetical protein
MLDLCLFITHVLPNFSRVLWRRRCLLAACEMNQAMANIDGPQRMLTPKAVASHVYSFMHGLLQGRDNELTN